LSALSLLGLGIVIDNAWIVRAAALAGAIGAAAFGAFFVAALRRMGRPRVPTRPAAIA
jgi:hypothetical protein